MKLTKRSAALSAGVLVAGLGGVAWGCGGGEAVPVGPGADSGADTTVAGDADPGTDGGASDGGGDALAFPDVRNVVDGRAPDPGQVRCGDAGACDTQTEICCVQASFSLDGGLGGLDAGSATLSCVPRRDAGACTGARIGCDEKADCPGAAVCCFSLGLGPAQSGSRCEAQCGVGEVQLCRTDAECNGTRCVAQDCRGRHIQSCGGLPPLVCP